MRWMFWHLEALIKQGRKGMDTALLIQILLWVAVVSIAFYFIIHYIVKSGGNVPGEDLLTPKP